MNAPRPETSLTRSFRYLVPFFLLLIPLWQTQVNAIVPEPYLDEVFHVGQAQAYWAHKWKHWDPKITTPAGLYLWSYFLCASLLLLRGSPKQVGAVELRATNVAPASLLLPWRLQILLDHLRKERNMRPVGSWVSHTVLNICLFPPLFFFSALYYTDILSLLVVLEAYIRDIRRFTNAKRGSTWSSTLAGHASTRTLIFLIIGLTSLLFRQTNIFWVAVFLGGLQVVRTLREVSPPSQSRDFNGIVMEGLQGKLYDPLLKDASFIDFTKTCISLLIATVNNLFLVVAAVLPHIIILVAFGLFILWNGGVVLGHKEFHTVGLHLPQMLYIWPYFAFFSWPIILVPLLNIIVPRAYIPRSLHYEFISKKRLPGLLTALGTIAAMLIAVHFNTIVHPFTLADNRHYMFYIFRILMRYHPVIKYAVTIIYFLCGWAVLITFGFSDPLPQLQIPVASKSGVNFPSSQQRTTNGKTARRKGESTPKSHPREPPAPLLRQQVTPGIAAKIESYVLQRRREHEDLEIRVSFVAIWLVSTALSLITAPLVEPRYFIIPWVMWRLHLPRPTPSEYRSKRLNNEKDILKAALATSFPESLETIWFVAINSITCHAFLYKGFKWPQEPGKVQRFMW